MKTIYGKQCSAHSSQNPECGEFYITSDPISSTNKVKKQFVDEKVSLTSFTVQDLNKLTAKILWDNKEYLKT